ncbi:MAG: class I mannose-6-phosphate isomerase [bacterium]|nr:class I mannose-6-phosphate isomerase [bacterium]
MIPDLLRLKPFYRETIWGGKTLARGYNKTLPADQNIGEAWEVSAYEKMESIVVDGPLAGQTLLQLVQTYAGDLLGGPVVDRYGTEFPLLIKLLDARDDLSIQVHPDDGYARSNKLGTYGKMEAWYVLQSEQGRVAFGLQAGIDKKTFAAAVRENRISEAIRFFDVRAGDVVSVPPGTVHALCKNVLVYEVQQSSDLTFRIFDYNRPGPDGGPRELHIDRSLEVISFGGPASEPIYWADLPGATKEYALLVQSEQFKLERFSPPSRVDHSYLSFSALTVIEGRVDLKGPSQSALAQKGDTFFIPANRPISASSHDGAEYLISSVPC